MAEEHRTSPEDVAERLGVSVATIRRWRVAAQLPERQPGQGYTEAEIALLRLQQRYRRREEAEAEPPSPARPFSDADQLPPNISIPPRTMSGTAADTSDRYGFAGQFVTNERSLSERLEHIERQNTRIEEQNARIEAQNARIEEQVYRIGRQIEQTRLAVERLVLGTPIDIYQAEATVESMPPTPSLLPASDRPSPRSAGRLAMHEERVPPDLPPGTVPLTVFAEQTGVNIGTLKSRLKPGVTPANKLETTQRDAGASNGRVYHYLTPEQQRKALLQWHLAWFPHQEHRYCPEPHAADRQAEDQ